MTKAHRVGHSRLRRARMDLEAEKRAHDKFIKQQDRAIAIKAALLKLKLEGEKPSDHEVTALDFY